MYKAPPTDWRGLHSGEGLDLLGDPCKEWGLRADDGDALLDVLAALNLVDHGDGVVGVGDDRLVPAVERELFTGEEILARALAVGLEVGGRADERPLDVIALPELCQFLALCPRNRQEFCREIRAIA